MSSAATTAAATGEPPAPAFDPALLLAKSGAENFPVATRVLPRRARAHLLAVYGYARLVDDVGDLAEGDRVAQLDWVESELDRALAGRATHPIFVRLSRTAEELGLTREPFADLLEANRQDQRVGRYPTYGDLLAYCRLSANPVGRLVLAVLGEDQPISRELSDQVCTGLQLVEHWQDVAEDHAADRVYLPLEDLERFEVRVEDLGAASASTGVRRLLAFECARARALLLAGSPLIGRCRGAGRLAVAGFVGGGLAQLDRIERLRFDVLGHRAKATKAAVLAATATALLGKGGRR